MKYAVITGAGSGIGRAFATVLLGKGYSVALAGRVIGKLEETAAFEGSIHPHALIVPADIRIAESVSELFKRIRSEFGRLDLLFNNAGINVNAPLHEIGYEEWRAVIDTNLTGTFLCTREAFKIMKGQSPQGGRIINNGSISAAVPRPFSAPYTASKHAITGLTKSTSLEGRKYNIVCSQIDIGNVATKMTSKMNKGVPQADGSVRSEPTMSMENVTSALLYMAELPLDANVQFMTLMASQMPFIGRG